MGGAAAALPALAFRAGDGDESAGPGPRDRRRRTQGLQRGFGHAGGLAAGRLDLQPRLGRARRHRHRQRDAWPRAGREAAAGAGALRSDGQSLRLVCVRARRSRGSALADHCARRIELGGKMKKEHINPKELGAPPRFYSHAVSIAAPAKLVYVSGQVSWGPDGKVVGAGDMRAQCKQVFDNVTAVLKSAGAGWNDIIKINGYMVGVTPDNVAAYREVRQNYLKPGRMPASTLVG